MRVCGGHPGVVLLACAWAGCGVPAAPPRGFGSHQILAARDPQLVLGGFTQDESKVYLGRYVQLRPALGLPPPHDLSTLDLVTAQSELVAPAVFSTVQLAGESGRGRSLALLHYPSDADVPTDFTSIEGPRPGHLQLSLVDETTGRHLDIADVADRNPIRFGATAFDPLAVDRYDPWVSGPAGAGGAENVQIWFGPPDALQPVPAIFASILGFDASGALGLMSLAGFAADIRHIPFAGGDGSIIVTADLGDHVVIPDESGAAIEPEAAWGGPRNPRYWCVPASPEAPPRCFFVYARGQNSSAPARLFARATDDPREVALPGVLESSAVLESPRAFQSPGVIQSATALLWTAGGTSGNHLYSWTFGADRVGGCDVPPGLILEVVWTEAQDRFAVHVAPVDAEGVRSPGVLVLGVPGGPCRVITPAASPYFFWTFSPDGTVLDWHEFLSGGSTAIHLTATDGSGERRIDLPGIIYTSEFHGDQRLLFMRPSGDGTSLSFIDLAEDSIRDHAIADRLATRRVWIDDSWLLLGDALSSQDDTFTLRAVNIDTGASRLVSSAVVGFVTPWTVRPDGVTTLSVAYLVRGRTPSAQDGIWLASLPLDDFLP